MSFNLLPFLLVLLCDLWDPLKFNYVMSFVFLNSYGAHPADCVDMKVRFVPLRGFVQSFMPGCNVTFLKLGRSNNHFYPTNLFCFPFPSSWGSVWCIVYAAKATINTPVVFVVQ